MPQNRVFPRIAVVAAAAIACAAPAGAQTVVKLADVKVAFTTPAGYKKGATKGLPSGTVFASLGPADDSFQANINLRVTPGPRGQMPADFVDRLAESLEFGMPAGVRYKVVSKGNSTVAGERAAVVTGGMVLAGRDLRNCQVVIARDGRIYVFTFTCAASAFEKRVRPFLTMMGSVRLLP